MEYHIYVAEENKSRFIAILEDLYKNNSIPFNYKIVDYTLGKSICSICSYSYKISVVIKCSEESLIKIMEFSSSITSIIAICTSSADKYKYREIIWYYDQEIGKTTIENNANSYDNFQKMIYACRLTQIYPYNAPVYCIRYDDTYKKC